MGIDERDHREEQPGRFDFTIETKVIDKSRGLYEIRMVPDERRYDSFTDENGTHYIDKFLKVLIPAKVMMESMAKQLPGIPIYMLQPSIESASKYAAERGAAIRSELATGKHVPPEHSARRHRPFADNPDARNVAFLSIDIVGGSALRARNASAFEQTHRIMFREFASTIGQFNGSVIKATGDGCIACIDHPSFTSTCDAAADLGLSLLVILRDAVGPALSAAGLQPVQVRIGGDYGLAEIRTIEVPATGFIEREVASDALNRAVKIEQTCGANEFRVGYDLYSLMHVKWLERAEAVEFDPQSVGMNNYKVFRLR